MFTFCLAPHALRFPLGRAAVGTAGAALGAGPVLWESLAVQQEVWASAARVLGFPRCGPRAPLWPLQPPARLEGVGGQVLQGEPEEPSSSDAQPLFHRCGN